MLAGGNASLYPTPNAFPTAAQWAAGFVDPAHGDFNVLAGSVLAKSGCGGIVPGANLITLSAAAGGGAAAEAIAAANRAPIADADATRRYARPGSGRQGR